MIAGTQVVAAAAIVADSMVVSERDADGSIAAGPEGGTGRRRDGNGWETAEGRETRGSPVAAENGEGGVDRRAAYAGGLDRPARGGSSCQR